MKYSPEFIENVKEAFPDWKEIQRHAENGTEVLGRYLSDSAPSSDAAFLARFIVSGDTENAMKRAKEMLLRQELCSEWNKTYFK